MTKTVLLEKIFLNIFGIHFVMNAGSGMSMINNTTISKTRNDRTADHRRVAIISVFNQFFLFN